jgi:hypothetical protein
MKRLSHAFGRARKAITAGVTAGVPILVAAMQDSSPGGSDLTRAEWMFLAGSTVLAFLAVYNMTNDAPQDVTVPAYPIVGVDDK